MQECNQKWFQDFRALWHFKVDPVLKIDVTFYKQAESTCILIWISCKMFSEHFHAQIILQRLHNVFLSRGNTCTSIKYLNNIFIRSCINMSMSTLSNYCPGDNNSILAQLKYKTTIFFWKLYLRKPVLLPNCTVRNYWDIPKILNNMVRPAA